MKLVAWYLAYVLEVVPVLHGYGAVSTRGSNLESPFQPVLFCSCRLKGGRRAVPARARELVGVGPRMSRAARAARAAPAYQSRLSSSGVTNNRSAIKPWDLRFSRARRALCTITAESFDADILHAQGCFPTAD